MCPLLTSRVQLEGLTLEEIGQKWDDKIIEIIKAPGGPFEHANKKKKL